MGNFWEDECKINTSTENTQSHSLPYDNKTHCCARCTFSDRLDPPKPIGDRLLKQDQGSEPSSNGLTVRSHQRINLRLWPLWPLAASCRQERRVIQAALQTPHRVEAPTSSL